MLSRSNRASRSASRLYQAGAWARIARFGIGVWAAVWIWAIVDSYDGSAASVWKPAVAGFVVAVAADQRARRMGLEVRSGCVIFHYAIRRRRFESAEIIRFDLERRTEKITSARTAVVTAQTASGARVRVPTLAFVSPGWRERVFGVAALVWQDGSSPDIELVLNRSLKQSTPQAVEPARP